MEIEIVTTKKKLTKSLFEQINWLSIHRVLEDKQMEVLGYVNFPGKLPQILLKQDGLYYRSPLYKQYQVNKQRIDFGDGAIESEFNSEEDCVKAARILKRIKFLALNKQIFL
jgi:hypothetical protein